MNAKIWGIIGGVALVLAFLSPLVLGNSKKIEQFFEEAEDLYERSDYKGAITKYSQALKESRKFGAKTEMIDKDFTTLVNLKIAQCYYELGEETSDVRHYQNALTHIKKVVLDTQVSKHQEELTYLWAENLYKIGNLDQAKSKFSWLIEKFPNSGQIPKALYITGNINVKQENYNEALSVFEKLVDKFPNSQWDPKALYAIGNIKYQQKNYEETLSAFQRLLEKFPDFEYKEEIEDRIAELNWLIENREVQEMYNAACALKQQGRIHDAYQLYTNLITQFPDSRYYVTEAYVGKAEIHLEAEGYVNARANYEEAMRSTADEERRIELHEAYHRTYLVPVYADRPIQRDPSGELFVKARLLRKEERWLEAAEIYMQLANSTLPAEDTVYSLYWAGRCYHEATSIIASLFGKSVDAFDKLIAEYEDSSYTIAVYYHLSLAYTDWAKISGDESKWQLVINTVEEANTKYADSDDTTVQGWLSRMQKLREEALKKLPPQPDLLKEEAEVAIKTAETEITRAKQENREPLLIHEANEHLKHAKHHMRQNDYTDALSSAEKALEVINKIRPKPSPIENYVEQGYIYLKQNELEAATQKARQALNLNPTYAPAHKLNSKIKHRYYGLGWMFFDEGQYNKAITEFKNAINIDSNFKEAHCHLGVIYIEQQKYAEAIQTLEKAISIDEAFKEAHFNLALAHLELGEFAEATNAANAALNIDPYYEPADILIKLIAD